MTHPTEHDRLLAMYAARARSGADASPRKPTALELSRGNDQALVMLQRAERVEAMAETADSGATATEARDIARTTRSLALRVAAGDAHTRACPDCRRTVWHVRTSSGWADYEAGRYLAIHECSRA
jgi:hypothetical protein